MENWACRFVISTSVECPMSWQPCSYCLLLAGVFSMGLFVAADEPAREKTLLAKLEPFMQPPAEYKGKFGSYRSPLKFADGSMAKTREDWGRRRAEILKTWHGRLGSWPQLVDRPRVKKLESIERDGYTQHRIQ